MSDLLLDVEDEAELLSSAMASNVSSKSESVSHESRTSATRSSRSASDTSMAASLSCATVGTAGNLSTASAWALRRGGFTPLAAPRLVLMGAEVAGAEMQRCLLGAAVV